MPIYIDTPVITGGLAGQVLSKASDEDNDLAWNDVLTWYGDTYVPDNNIGLNNDFYLKTDNGDIYRKVAGSWLLIGNFKGPNGTIWYNEPNDPLDEVGVNYDYFLNTATGDIFQKQYYSWVHISNLLGGSTGQVPLHATRHITGGTDVIPDAEANGNSGLFSGTDKAKLDGLSTVILELSDNNPATLTIGDSAAPGTDTEASRSDHVHGMPPFGDFSGSICEGNDSRLADTTTTSKGIMQVGSGLKVNNGLVEVDTGPLLLFSLIFGG